jgi:hypothetical protein
LCFARPDRDFLLPHLRHVADAAGELAKLAKIILTSHNNACQPMEYFRQPFAEIKISAAGKAIIR